MNTSCFYTLHCSVPNITHVWSAYASQDRFHIIMEYCQGGNLLEHLKAAAAPIPEPQLAAMVSTSRVASQQQQPSLCMLASASTTRVADGTQRCQCHVTSETAVDVGSSCKQLAVYPACIPLCSPTTILSQSSVAYPADRCTPTAHPSSHARSRHHTPRHQTRECIP